MKNVYFLIIILVLTGFELVAQVTTQKDQLVTLSGKYLQQAQQDKQKAIEYAKAHNIPLRIENDSVVMELMMIDERGKPQYYTTHNENAAKTVSTNKVYAGGGAGLSLDGSGTLVGEWDGGSVRVTHQEFDTRVTVMDGAPNHWHSTHVAGTIMAAGVVAAAKGMAFSAGLRSYDWNYDVSEMATEAAEGLLISNHSYGYLRGWQGGTKWWGDTTISKSEDYLFGFYDNNTRNWDEVAYNAPNYLIVKSSGNDRDEGPLGGGYPKDGPYDCISQQGVAKNILTVGAVNDIAGGYTAPIDVVMSSFSSWGPADDGRIKPDIVANGIGLYSAYSSSDVAYSSSSGTSMSSPSVAGSLALLAQHYENENGVGAKMRAATMKALVLHTADEAGSNDGPDYQFGWGLLNTESAAAKISEDQTTDVISEHVLVDGETFTRYITTTGTSPIKVTLVWTDPPGNPPEASLDPPDPMLINDLDLRITESTFTYYPWSLDVNNPANAATHLTENNVDNVEMVDILTPLAATTYTITVDHDGILSSPQAFSMIITGDIENAVAPVADFSANNVEPTTSQTVLFTDASVNIPNTWSWSFSPSTVSFINGTSSISKNPEVLFEETGYYEVSLNVSNIHGVDTETKTAYISVVDAPTNYCDAYSLYVYGLISQVQIGTIDNPSSYTNVGGATGDLYYEDFTALVADVFVGENISISITNYYADSELDLAIWIDWNRDGDFEDANEEIACVNNNGGQGTFNIEVPVDAQVGLTRMRIRSKWNDWYGCLPCGTTYEGEVEDYSIGIVGTNQWLGITSSDWSDASNWTKGVVPDEFYKVIVPTGVLSPVVISGVNAKCYSLTLEENATLTIDGNLEIGN